MPSDYAIRRKPYPTASATIEYVKMQQPGGEEDIGESRQLPDAEKERQAGRSGRSLFGLWKYELLSILGSCLAFAAIVVLLRVFDEQDLSSWKSIISINTFISILTTLFKGAVAVTLSSGIGQLKWIWFSKRARSLADLSRFDMASIGPWGCTLLIARQFRGQRIPFLATFGALIVVLSLAVDPFSQATTSVESCVRILTDTASIPRFNIPRRHIQGQQYNYVISYDMQFAFFAGLYNPPPNSSVAVQVTCSSGNCTFPDAFTTLDLCHQCSDVSSQLEMTNNSTWLLPDYNSTVSKGFAMNLKPEYDIWAQMTTSSNKTGGKPTGRVNEGMSLFDFQMLFMTCQGNATAQIPSSDCIQVAKAYRCDFTPCVKTYSAGVTNHIYAEHKVIAERRYLDPVVLNSSGEKAFQLGVNRTFHNGTWSTCSSSKVKTDQNTFAVSSIDSYRKALDTPTLDVSAVDAGELYYRPECVFEVPAADTNGMIKFARDLFGSARIAVPYKGPYLGPPWLQNLWNRGRVNMSAVDEFSRGIATSIGARWRKDGVWGNSLLPTVDRVPGQNQELRPCIKVHWRFLSFPGVILAGEIAFFIFVAVVNLRAQWQGDWKASTVPHVLPYLPEPHIEEADNGTEHDIYQQSKGAKAIFTPVNGRWRLRAVL